MPGSPVLDRFIPCPDARERFETVVKAPAPAMLDVACTTDLQSLPLVRAIFRARERLMRVAPTEVPRRSGGLVAETVGLGWGLLVDDPGHRVVFGAHCRYLMMPAVRRRAEARWAEAGHAS